MMKVFQKEYGNHGHFKLSGMDRSGYATFTISHYNGPVTYSSEALFDFRASSSVLMMIPSSSFKQARLSKNPTGGETAASPSSVISC
jgi:hypothetical protein